VVQAFGIDVKGATRRQQYASGRAAPVSRKRGQARDRAHRIAAAGDALHAVVQADRGRADVPVIVGELFDLRRRDAAQGRHARRVELYRARGERLEPQRVALDVVAVEPAFADQHVHQPERKRAVGAGQQRDVLVAFLGGRRAIRIDRNQLRAVALGFLREAPQVQVGRDRIRAPEQDQLGVGKRLHRRTSAHAERADEGLAARGRADGAIEQARAEPVEEAVRHRLALHQPHRARVRVRHDALWIDRGDRLQLRGNVVERFVPRHARELALALAAAPLQRMQHALRVIGALEIPADLRAQRAARGRMVRVARDLDRHALAVVIAHRHQHRAGVGAIVRTGGVDRFERGIGARHASMLTHAVSSRPECGRRLAQSRRACAVAQCPSHRSSACSSAAGMIRNRPDTAADRMISRYTAKPPSTKHIA
jgi:hypothetical protein